MAPNRPQTLIRLDVSVGSKAALTAPKSNFRFTLESGPNPDIALRPESAKSGPHKVIRVCSAILMAPKSPIYRLDGVVSDVNFSGVARTHSLGWLECPSRGNCR